MRNEGLKENNIPIAILDDRKFNVSRLPRLLLIRLKASPSTTLWTTRGLI